MLLDNSIIFIPQEIGLEILLKSFFVSFMVNGLLAKCFTMHINAKR